MSFLYFGLLAAHIAAGAIIAALLIRLARRHGKAGWIVSLLIVASTYLVVFWDVIPTAALHTYLCKTQAGVSIFKDAGTWAREHPDEARTIRKPVVSTAITSIGGHPGYWLTTAHYLQFQVNAFPIFPVRLHYDNIVDARSGEIVAQKRWVASGYRRTDSILQQLNLLKGWVGLEDCTKDIDAFQGAVRAYEGLRGTDQ